MCGRFTLRSPAESIASLFEGLEVPEWIPRYNIAPTQGAPTVRYREGKPIFTPLRWGLVPSWAKELAVGNRMINARSETVDSKPAFRDAFQKRRCLIVADGFFEWKNVGKRKFPFYITRVDGRPFCMAGLWETWGPAGAEIETCTILTTVANACLEPLHERMPVLLSPEDYGTWLDNRFCAQSDLLDLLRPSSSEELTLREVSRMVNKVTNDNPACVEPEPTLFD